MISDGVYAVNANGKLIDYTTADSTALGVALVAGEHKFMIAKSDATDGTNTILYWGKNLFQKDVAGITNISSGAGYIGEGKKYGTDFTTWSTGPVVDFNGAANTAAIIAGYTEHGVSMDARDMCTVLNTFNASDGYNDWYIPACGQLALMYLAKTDINAALAKIGGTAFESNGYWSSSEDGAGGAWYVYFDSGGVDRSGKSHGNRVRFIRDIPVPKPLKERVSDLESKIKDLNTSGSSNGAYAEVNHGTSDTTFVLTPNTFHVWDEVASLDLSFADETAGVANEYLFQFTSGATATTLTLPDVKWANDSAPTITENKIYQVSILKGLASVLEFSNAPSKITNTIKQNGTNLVFDYPVASEVTVVFYGRASGSAASSAPTDVTLVYSVGEQSKAIKTLFNFVSVTPSEDDTYIYTF